MPELPISPRRVSVAASVTVLIALFVSALVLTASGSAAGKAPSCPAAKKKSACSTASTRLRYKIIRKRILVTVPHATAKEGLSQVVTLSCPHDEQVLGGGAEVYEPYLSVKLSAPDEATTGWSAQVANFSTTTDFVAWVGVYAACELPPTTK